MVKNGLFYIYFFRQISTYLSQYQAPFYICAPQPQSRQSARLFHQSSELGPPPPHTPHTPRVRLKTVFSCFISENIIQNLLIPQIHNINSIPLQDYTYINFLLYCMYYNCLFYVLYNLFIGKGDEEKEYYIFFQRTKAEFMMYIVQYNFVEVSGFNLQTSQT